MNNTLKRCPFCGGSAKIFSTFCEVKFFAACTFCGNRTPFVDNPKKARKAWNKRIHVN